MDAGGSLVPVLGGHSYAADRENAKFAFLTARLAAGTRSGYEGAWKQGCLFCRARTRTPFLTGETRQERQEDEEVLLDYIVHLVKYFKGTEGTVKLKLFAADGLSLAVGMCARRQEDCGRQVCCVGPGGTQR